MLTLSKETEALATELAAARRLSVEETVRQALETWARAVDVGDVPGKRRDTSAAAIARRMASIDRIVAEIAEMPVLDCRSPREIMDDLDSL